MILLSIQAFSKELLHRSPVILVGVVPFCLSLELFVVCFFVTDFSSTISKTSAGISLSFQTRDKDFTWFYCFRAFEINFPAKKIIRNYHFKKFSELNHTVFETWKVHLVSARWCVILFHLHSMPRCYLTV